MSSETVRADLAVAVWSAILRLHAATVSDFDAHLRRATGLPLSWYDVLLELDGPGRLRVGELGDAVVLSRTRVSRLIADLAAQDLVRRESNPDDGRSAFVAITDAGRRALRAAAPTYLADIGERFGVLSADELAVVAAALNRVLDEAPKK